jgi:hypothetical protein
LNGTPAPPSTRTRNTFTFAGSGVLPSCSIAVLHVAQFRQDALTGFELTGPEKLALLTGDINWIQNHIGAVTPAQKQWLEGQISGEVW